MLQGPVDGIQPSHDKDVPPLHTEHYSLEQRSAVAILKATGKGHGQSDLALERGDIPKG